jgi:exodeoxyribonuclease V alpha subunit
MTLDQVGAETPIVLEAQRSASVVQGVAPASLLGAFNRAGILSAADLHVASCLVRLAKESEVTVALGAAFAVRAPRVGHVYVDLASIRYTAAAGDDHDEATLEALLWPEPASWVDAMAASPLVASNPTGRSVDVPLVLEGSALYLNRLWRDEVAVADALLARTSAAPVILGADASEMLDRLFPDDSSSEQRHAAVTAFERRLAVIVGGPGTGKTTTVARLLAALFEDSDRRGDRSPLVGLAAPTGKAAARLAEAVQSVAQGLEPAMGSRLGGLRASTVHRLLGSRPGVATRFVHDAGNPLPYDVVVIDETSMLPLWLMNRLLEAVRADAHLVLLGDPDQLASVEAGVVLADIVGPTTSVPTSVVSESGSAHGVRDPGGGVVNCVVVLRTNHRFSGALSELADAVRSCEPDRAIEILDSGDPALEWIAEQAGLHPTADEFLEQLSLGHGRRLVDAARGVDPEAALRTVEDFRVLCAHQNGPAGASWWNNRIEKLVAQEAGVGTGWGFYVGRPVIVTANDYGMRLFNGDVGVVMPRADGGVEVVFRRGDELISVSPSQLSSLAGVYAMTVHKAQGSEFDEVAVVLPEPSSRILTRELLYTAVTRARRRVRIVGSEEALRAGIERRVARASGLMRRLWGGPADAD